MLAGSMVFTGIFILVCDTPHHESSVTFLTTRFYEHFSDTPETLGMGGEERVC